MCHQEAVVICHVIRWVKKGSERTGSSEFFIADRSKVVGHRGKDGTDGNGTAMKTEKRVSCWKSPTAVANGRREKRRRKGERGEGRARMLRASPFCLNVVYAVARQQPLRSIHI
ncbi:hypothetical protein ANTPLA_LOCUS1689 [Anthophora plagiata]